MATDVTGAQRAGAVPAPGQSLRQRAWTEGVYIYIYTHIYYYLSLSIYICVGMCIYIYIYTHMHEHIIYYNNT